MERDIVDTLKDAKDHRKSWVETARVFALRPAHSGEEKKTFENRAVELSKYSLNVLRRFEFVRNYVQALPDVLKPADRTIERSFSALEIIERISRLDKEREKYWLEKLVAGKARDRHRQ